MSQQIEIPAFLLEMSQQMHQQSNRCTAEPIWQVRCKRYLVTESGYSEHHWEIVDEEGDAFYHSEEDSGLSELAICIFESHTEWASSFWGRHEETRFLDCTESDFVDSFNKNFDPDWIDLPGGFKKIYFQETEEVIKTCFTEADALAFIARKQHDYPKLYTYVESMVFCPQMIELRNWIMSLTKLSEAA